MLGAHGVLISFTRAARVSWHQQGRLCEEVRIRRDLRKVKITEHVFVASFSCLHLNLESLEARQLVLSCGVV